MSESGQFQCQNPESADHAGTVRAAHRYDEFIDQWIVTLTGQSGSLLVSGLTALDAPDGGKLWTTQQWSGDATRRVWNTRIVETLVRKAASAR